MSFVVLETLQRTREKSDNAQGRQIKNCVQVDTALGSIKLLCKWVQATNTLYEYSQDYQFLFNIMNVVLIK